LGYGSAICVVAIGFYFVGFLVAVYMHRR